MKRFFTTLLLSFCISSANAQNPQGPVTPGYTTNGSNWQYTSPTTPLPVAPSAYPSGATAITGNASGTTGAVVGTLAAAANKFTYICGVHIDASGTGSIGPITIAGIVGSSMIFQATAGALGTNGLPTQTFSPCIPSSAVNTAITITTTADGTATAVNVNSWGFQQ